MAVGSLRHQHPKGKSKMTSFRRVCRSVLDHPFLIILVVFLICLHRYFPFLFFLLVSASPVIICAAILLGTLLIYGQPNDNNVKYNEEMSNTRVTTGVNDHTYSTDREGILTKDRFSEVRNDIVEKGMRASGMLSSGISVTGDLVNVVDREYCNAERSKGSTIYKEKINNSFGFANFEKADAQMPWDREYGNSIKGHHDAGMQEKHADDTVNHEYSDCESNGAEKSSFDALVADVIPTAQETHPLLDSEDPLHPDASHGSSLKFDLQSLVTDHSSEDSGDDDIDKNEALKARDDENVAGSWMEMEKSQHLESLFTRTIEERDEEEGEDDDESNDDEVDEEYDDDEEEENTNVEKDESKQVTMWTEEDEKNLRLVGNSELERDLRLENLLARRRAKRNFSMISERNLIDLDRPDIPFQIPPISTTRVNPFDTPVSTYQQQFGIPPIPGSAPSVSVPRKNPFESPCTSPKGIQNLAEEHKEETMEMNLNDAIFHENGSSSTGYNPLGDILKPDFVEVNRKDAVFRRYESFSTGYNFMGDTSRQDFMETDRREAVLRRHETFNTRSTFRNVVTTPEKLAYLKMKPVFVPEQVGDHEMRHPSSGGESSHDSDSTVSSSNSDHIESPTILSMQEDAESNKDLIAESDHASIHSEDSRSESSDSVDSLHNDPEEFVDSLETNAELHADHIYQKADAAHENEDDTSSSSSTTSEVDHSSEKLGQGEDEAVNNNFVHSPKASSTMSDINPVNMEEDHGIIEPPVFDSSPSGTDKITPFSITDLKSNVEI
ncbi:histone acetyltransferase KAT6B-like [Chenopodium quinoa]|uniref:histone acetyltransferase KAT6B-like n=1 Tax=Chenopodium quinoa TaxID=63459 RepID=UPI000B787959|nr:histone acetyltransferase KAT6B-like [Chenopodium quinoa]